MVLRSPRDVAPASASRRRAAPNRLAVVGAHLSGQPLNHQLLDLRRPAGGATTTAPAYRLFDLGTTPAEARDGAGGTGGAAIEVEVWELDAPGSGRSCRVPAPLAIGSVELADGSVVPGFLCDRTR